MIVVIVISGIIAGIVAIFIKAPVQGYVDSARRAELTDVADLAVRRISRDIRTSVPNSIRISACSSLCVEFLPTKDGGRYRAVETGAGPSDVLDFSIADTSFDSLGPAITFANGDQIVVGSTESSGNPPYQDVTTVAMCNRRPVSAFGALTNVSITSANPFPPFSRLWDASPASQRFDVVDGVQQAVTYSCEGTLGTLDANGDGQGTLVRHWGYGFNPAQVAPASLGGSSSILADKVSGCQIDYAPANQRYGLLSVRLTLTRGGESVTLYNETHVSNAP
jgi:MSHA biogenesis protein MshO